MAMLLKIKNFLRIFVGFFKSPTHFCNCVCHCPASSRPYCEHCEPEWMKNITEEEAEKARKFLKTIPKFYYDSEVSLVNKGVKEGKLDENLDQFREGLKLVVGHLNIKR